MSDTDVLAAQLQAIDQKLDRALDDHTRWLHEQDKRLRSIERWVYALPPTLVFAAASLGVAVLR